MGFYCNGKKGFCECDILCADCRCYDNTGGQHITTNADRIRAMSDEELAKVLDAFTAYFDECNRSADEIDCRNCELISRCSLDEGKAFKCLKQPVEEDNE